MKIAIYEINHLEWLLPLCELLWDTDYEISLITSAAFESDLRENLGEKCGKFHWTFVPANSGGLKIYRQFRALFEKGEFDLVLLNTIDAYHGPLYLALRGHRGSVVINLHDINNFFVWPPLLNLRLLARTIGKKLVADRASAYVVNFDGMRDYLLEKKFTAKPVYHFVPVYPMHSTGLPKDYISVVAPGSIDHRRRDYELLLSAWELFGKKDAGLTLAGRPVGEYGERIIEQAKLMAGRGFKIRYYLDDVPEKDFRRIISESTIVVAPTVIQTSIHDGIIEQYGWSKYSGNIYDAMRFGKPLFMTRGVGVPASYAKSCRFFSNADELALLLNMSGSELNELQETARRSLENYDKAKVKEQLLQLLALNANSESRLL